MNEYQLERVQNYFAGTMSREEALQFEDELKTNPELAFACNLFRQIEAGINTEEESFEELRLRKTLKGLHHQYQQEFPQSPQLGNHSLSVVETANGTHIVAAPNANKPIRDSEKSSGVFLWKPLVAVAIFACVILLGGIMYFQMRTDQNFSHQQKINRRNGSSDTSDLQTTAAENKLNRERPGNTTAIDSQSKAIPLTPAKSDSLYTRYFQPDALPADYSALLQPALLQYKEGKYNDAIAALDVKSIEAGLEEIRPRGASNPAQEREEKQTIFFCRYYKGLSYLAISQAKKAIPELIAAVKKSQGGIFKDRAQWYLALAYLKEGNTSETMKLLKNLAGSKAAGLYQKKAIALATQLNNFRLIK